jgi:Protein of unknown function (DUF1559)
MAFHDSRISFKTQRSAFTVIEVLVTLSAILLLLGCLVVAVQMARESSRKASCSNNLKQWVTGILSFEAKKKKLPAGGELTTSLPFSNPRFSETYLTGPWLIVLREIDGNIDRYKDQLELQEILNETDLVHPSFASCPSDPAVKSLAYRFNTGSSGARGEFKRAVGREKPNGPFRSRPQDITTSEITDGLSNVVAMSERYGGRKGTKTHFRNLNAGLEWMLQVQRVQPDDYETLCNDIRSFEMPTMGYYSIPTMKNWEAILYSHVFNPNTEIEDCAASNIDWSIAARSHHSGGVNAGILDGSVHFVSNTVERKVWRELGGIADGGICPAQ